MKMMPTPALTVEELPRRPAERPREPDAREDDQYQIPNSSV